MSDLSSRLLVIDADSAVRSVVLQRLRREDCEVLEASSATAARKILAEGVDVALLADRLPDGSTIDFFAEAHLRRPSLAIIVMAEYTSVARAVAAMRAGAFHYIEKPLDLDELQRTVDEALAVTQIQKEVIDLARRPVVGSELIIGKSREMQKVKKLVTKVASSPGSTVLITGESGTGKDLVARSVHAQSERSSGPFLNITCSALPAALLESELFGHERGAFTDAKQRKIGLFEQANGGTVFLDEIGEMEPGPQAKLLRFLEDKSFRRVGGIGDLRADIRIVAATNVDLRGAVRKQVFREDLYYRLAVLTIHLPPLRDRAGDAELIAQHLVEHFNAEFGRSIQSISPGAIEIIRSHAWPGNVRELRNAIERAVLLAPSDELTEEDLDCLQGTEKRAEFTLPSAGIQLDDVERSFVEQALERCRGNRVRAARLLGLNRDQIRSRMMQHGLKS